MLTIRAPNLQAAELFTNAFEPSRAYTSYWFVDNDRKQGHFGYRVGAGAPSYSGALDHQGKVFVFHGSSQGLGTQALWAAVGNFNGAAFGLSLSAAGDINRDGYEDVIVGANHFAGVASNFVRACVFLGSADGLQTNLHWLAESAQGRAEYGLLSCKEAT
jgi:hypothetical protein